MENTPIIVFDDSSEDALLNALGLRRSGKEGILVDESGKVLTDQDFETLHADNLGGVLQGSKIAIRKDVSALVKYFSAQQKD
ncbi:MAG: hypothetical protein AABX47_08260 [Nanoarchaeota archaeon]